MNISLYTMRMYIYIAKYTYTWSIVVFILNKYASIKKILILLINYIVPQKFHQNIYSEKKKFNTWVNDLVYAYLIYYRIYNLYIY